LGESGYDPGISIKDTQELAQVALIDDHTQEKLFLDGADPTGQVHFIGSPSDALSETILRRRPHMDTNY
jgi:hypothetical protein